MDGIARDKFSVALDDPRRLAAALEEALYRVSEKGHTCASLDDFEDTVFRLVKPYSASLAAMSKALIQGKASASLSAVKPKPATSCCTPPAPT